MQRFLKVGYAMRGYLPSCFLKSGTASIILKQPLRLALLALAVAWLWIWRQSARSRLRPTASTLVMMGVATFLVASALFWPDIEPEILRAIAG